MDKGKWVSSKTAHRINEHTDLLEYSVIGKEGEIWISIPNWLLAPRYSYGGNGGRQAN